MHRVGRCESHFRVPGEKILDDLGVDCRGGVFLETVPNIEQQDAAALEHPTHLPEYGSLVRNKHDAEGADGRAELAVAEWQAGSVRLAPFDTLQLDPLVARVIQPGLVALPAATRAGFGVHFTS